MYVFIYLKYLLEHFCFLFIHRFLFHFILILFHFFLSVSDIKVEA